MSSKGDIVPSSAHWTGPNFPTFEITAANTEGSDNIDLLKPRFYDSFRTGVLIHQGNVGTNASTSAFHLLNLKFEDSGMSNITANNSNTLGGGDMLQFSGRKPNETETYTQQISDILCRNVDLVNPVLGYAALHVAADAGADASNIDCAQGTQPCRSSARPSCSQAPASVLHSPSAAPAR